MSLAQPFGVEQPSHVRQPALDRRREALQPELPQHSPEQLSAIVARAVPHISHQLRQLAGWNLLQSSRPELPGSRSLIRGAIRLGLDPRLVKRIILDDQPSPNTR